MQKLGNWGFKYVGVQDTALKLYPGGAPHPPYAIYILVIGPHFFQVMSFTFGLSSNFTPYLTVSRFG